jgi:UDP-N-acetylglucosamine--N-acetylmuramyl-(pentapeptide) pyrophosphoryl-undecaprenol N-acetylglucosamine transferase
VSLEISTNNPAGELKKNGLKILAVTGASGGHIFPVLAFLDSLKARGKGIEILLVLPKKNINQPIDNLNYGVRYISITSISLRASLKNISAVFNFLKGAVESLLILLEFKPALVVGFGSLTCIPMVLFAKFLGIKTLIHEQNMVPGRANRIMARFADRLAVSFRETSDYLKSCQDKTVLTGNPIRKELQRCDRREALDFFKLSDNKFTILVMGGSLGSHNINQGFLKSIPAFSDKKNLQVIHLAGAKDYESLEKSYQELDVSVRLYSFLKPMQYAYSACDLILSRAGATTITEIIYFAIPAIIVPYPYAYKHQSGNAKLLEKAGSAIIIEDSELGTTALPKVINELAKNPGKLKAMRSYYNNLSVPDADVLLVSEAFSLLNK